MLLTLRGCPYCETSALAVTDVNKVLPIGNKISIVENFPLHKINRVVADPRSEILNTDIANKEEWGFPLLQICNPKIKKFMNTYYKGKDNCVIVHSAYSHRHHVEFLKSFLKDHNSL